MFPMMGSFGGPGGNFSLLFKGFNDFRMRKMGIERKNMSEISHEISIVLVVLPNEKMYLISIFVDWD